MYAGLCMMHCLTAVHSVYLQQDMLVMKKDDLFLCKHCQVIFSSSV